VKGTYCLVIDLLRDSRLRVGAIGTHRFPAGVYVYIGSALSGIEHRVSRHVRKMKKRRWHIDYLLEQATVLAVIAIPSQIKDTECAVAQALMASEGADIAVKGFGSSDCGCPAHLLYFGREDPAWISEQISKTIAMLSCIYPSNTGSGRE
jgi:Uri superfamily endonuclease